MLAAAIVTFLPLIFWAGLRHLSRSQGRTILAMLLIVALAIVWNVMGGGVSLVTDRKQLRFLGLEMVMDNPITGAIKEAARMTNIIPANLSVDELERVSGGNTWLLVSARQPSSPHRQPIDPNPSMGSGYGGDSAGGSGGGGYFGDPNAPGHQQF